MKILLENMEDLREFMGFLIVDYPMFRQGLFDTPTKETHANIDKINTISKRLDECTEQINDLRKIIGSLENKKTDNTMKLSRKYTKSYTNPPKIKDVKPDGKLIGAYNRELSYTIFDLLRLQKCLKTDLPVTEIKKKYNLNITLTTIGKLLYGIDSGEFEHLFNKWAQLKADEFKSKFKTNMVAVNNPQKRKENGMV